MAKFTWPILFRVRRVVIVGSQWWKKSCWFSVWPAQGRCAWDRSVTGSEKGARKKRKRKGEIIIFRLESCIISRERIVVSIWNKKKWTFKEEEYILTRFFFYRIFPFRERWFLLDLLLISIIYGVIVKSLKRNYVFYVYTNGEYLILWI